MFISRLECEEEGVSAFVALCHENGHPTSTTRSRPRCVNIPAGGGIR